VAKFYYGTNRKPNRKKSPDAIDGRHYVPETNRYRLL
jgi:hypothetical protein